MSRTRYALWIKGERYEGETFEFASVAWLHAITKLMPLGVFYRDIEVRPV